MQSQANQSKINEREIKYDFFFVFLFLFFQKCDTDTEAIFGATGAKDNSIYTLPHNVPLFPRCCIPLNNILPKTMHNLSYIPA